LRAGALFIALALTALGLRLVWLQGVSASSYATRAEDQRLRTTTISAVRGQILDRNGNVLAQNVDARAIYVDQTEVSDPAREAQVLAPLIGVPAQTLQPQLTGTKRFVYLARNVTPAQGRAVTAASLGGIGVLPESHRSYPGGDLAANVVGFTNIDGKGLAGIESSFNTLLQGTAGTETVEVDPSGREIPGGYHKETKARPGGTVQLTLDQDIQYEAQRAIAAQVAATRAKSGTVIVLDSKTGQILADATAPSFNAAEPGKADPANTGNRTISDYYEPGSVNKMIVAAAALQTGALTPNSVLDIPSALHIADATFHDAEAHGDEKLTLTGILAKSSNIGAIEIAQRLGNATVDHYLKLFGLGAKTGIALPGETAGVLPDVNTWKPTQAATIPFGQGMDVSALQMVAAYGAVANGGVYVAPRIVQSSAGPDGVSKPATTSRRVMSTQNAALLRLMLEQVTTENGTAPAAQIPGYRIAGKTGTANAIGPDGRYDGHYTASFIGMAPADNPRLVVEVVLDHPQTSYYGGTVAAPVFKDVMSFALQSLGIPPSKGSPSALPLTG